MITKELALQKISALVERFEEQYTSYMKSEYNETLTRRDFIDPFFKALGWDMDNEQGNAEAYREVIHEDRLKIGTANKAPDYSFRLAGGKRLFFVEAKKPGVSVKDEIQPAYQIRRYGWSAKLPISIITDFQELSIYDCTVKPNPTDKASVARIGYLTFHEYLSKFDFIWDTFSKERVLKGSFDKFVQSDTQKKGTTTVDKEFLQSLDRWRTYLATSISWNNKGLDEDEINFAVQQTIDRIIFLRIAEDRGVEPYGNLKHSLGHGDYYQNLFEQFRKADEKYNSGLFDFHKDRICANLKIENKIIKTLINELYYPECPYEFSVLSVEILGSAYEQFLGKVIRITPAHHAKIEEKPEVRKAGGVYYTPQYIVEYIVKNTVGKLVEGKIPAEVNNIKIVDPACGSGSFLIGAYQYLLDWHKNYYTVNGKPSKGKKDNPLTPDGYLTTAEKKRILLNNIYGVDIDVNAVEVTKLSLLLKCLEGETEASIQQQFSLWNERVLPTLDNNIKSGNSLIDTDFYGAELDFGLDKKIKPFNWQKAFPDVFRIFIEDKNLDFKKQFLRVKQLDDDTTNLLEKYNAKEAVPMYDLAAGFDVIIGNPPYGALFEKAEIEYLKNKYQTAVWRVESYLLFLERGIKLLKPTGYLSYIIPDTLTNLRFTQPARELLLRNTILKEIVGLPSKVFTQATVDTIVLIAERSFYTEKFHPSNVLVKSFDKKQQISSLEVAKHEFLINTQEWYEQDHFNLHSDQLIMNLVKRIEVQEKKIKDIGLVLYGIKAYQTGKGIPPQTEKIKLSKPFTSRTQISADWLPFYDGQHIGRYKMLWNNNNWLHYGRWLAEPRKPVIFEGEKILIRKIIGKTVIATYSSYTSYCNTLLFIMKLRDMDYSYKGILAVLNSNLIGWYFRKKYQISADDTFPQIMIKDILNIPIPIIDSIIDQELNKLVDQLLLVNAYVQKENLESNRILMTTKIDYCENRINEIVYQLYGLTKEEIKIVEGN